MYKKASTVFFLKFLNKSSPLLPFPITKLPFISFKKQHEWTFQVKIMEKVFFSVFFYLKRSVENDEKERKTVFHIIRNRSLLCLEFLKFKRTKLHQRVEVSSSISFFVLLFTIHSWNNRKVKQKVCKVGKRKLSSLWYMKCLQMLKVTPRESFCSIL